MCYLCDIIFLQDSQDVKDGQSQHMLHLILIVQSWTVIKEKKKEPALVGRIGASIQLS